VRLLETLKRFRARSFDRRDQLPPEERTVENDDAWAQDATAMPNQVPPNYVPPADEGRPRH
jgi:hypothetical protein